MTVVDEPTREQIAAYQASWGYAPRTGICFGCGEFIYSSLELRRQAVQQVVTGCPHCHYSFID